jgi:hypothetical protein
MDDESPDEVEDSAADIEEDIAEGDTDEES